MTETLPLSAGQEAMWFLNRLAPDSAAYNVVMALRARGPLDLAVLGRALDAVVDRHPILRSRFADVAGAPRMFPGAAPAVRLEVREAAGSGEARLRELVAEAGSAPFDMAGEGVFRFVVLRTGPEDAVLVCAAHHLVTDAVAQGVVLRELLEAYRAFGCGESPQWPQEPVPFAEFVAEERELLASDRAAEFEEYWRGVCAGAPYVLELPADRPRPARADYTGASYEVTVPERVREKVRAGAAEAGTTPFSLLLAGFQALLHRYTGEGDFLIGMPTTTRLSRRSRAVVGCFVNTVVVRAGVGGSSTLPELAGKAQRQVREGMGRAAYPFSHLTRALGVPRETGRSPLVQVTFTMVAAGRSEPLMEVLAEGEESGRELELAGLRLSAFDVPQQEGQFDLAVELLQTSHSLKAVFRYRADLYDAATIERLAEHYLRLVEAGVDEPGTPVRRLSLVDRSERDRILALGLGAMP
ncbi:condensation domain-containing protein [Streptomyces sp. NPDC001678]|uniref:condensation domain-containing protein n=1 Tax=Streptomyces sp. NPDC001678 TaxID=3364599 RepID=UPI00368EC64A